MTTLLRFHFRYSSKSILFLIVFAILLSLLNLSEVININIVSLVMILSVYIPTMCIAHIIDARFSKLIRTFPISFTQYVKSAYLYTILLYSSMLIPVILVISYHYFYKDMTVFALCYALGIFAFTIATTGGALKAHFKQPTNHNSISGSDLFFYILFIFIVHTFLCFIFSYWGLVYVGALITPISCLVLYYKQYKASIELYGQAEYL
ncbi:hypothetical protein MKX47_04980 [Solibacillus sp. FSL R7-0668]|uniref:hypothetical protein n=1 Tax=Solibacillus sp. FSL R7-0668 TaxID=2921688 RepID=UPI0030FCB022